MSDSYRDRLVVALRLRDIPGPRIGEVVAEVEAYTADSGQDPTEAFGPADAYADEIAAALGRPARPRWRIRDLAWAYPPAVGALVLGDGVWGLVWGGPAELTLGEAAVAILLPLGALLLLAAVLRIRRWLYAVAAAIPIAGALVAWLGDGQILLRYSAWVALVLGAVLLVGGLLVVTVVGWDPVRDPRQRS
jgi:hypothetical protein